MTVFIPGITNGYGSTANRDHRIPISPGQIGDVVLSKSRSGRAVKQGGEGRVVESVRRVGRLRAGQQAGTRATRWSTIPALVNSDPKGWWFFRNTPLRDERDRRLDDA